MSLDSNMYKNSMQGEVGVTCIPDAIDFSQAKSKKTRFAVLLSAIVMGAAGGILLSTMGGVSVATAITAMFVVLAFAGGIFSTWSPCGYSSLSLLRPAGKYSMGSVVKWTPTFITHAIGYAFGALVLGGALGLVGFYAFGSLTFATMVAVLAVLAVAYGAHQLGFLKMPYPQRRAQVPHDARFRFRSSVIGLLYGYALGMNYLTYVQTPILYIVTGTALLAAGVTGNVWTAVAIIGVFNIGRCLPVAVNFLPISNHTVQLWLAKWQERVVELDGFLLVSMGIAALLLIAL